MKRSSPLVALVIGVIGIVFLRLLIVQAQADSSANPALVWAFAGVAVCAIVVATVVVVFFLRFLGDRRNKEFQKGHPEATWIVGFTNPDLEAQIILLGAAAKLRPSFIAAFDRYGLGFWQGPNSRLVLRVPWAQIRGIEAADVSSGTRRSPGVEVQLTSAPPTTLAFIIRDPARRLRPLNQHEVTDFLERARALMESSKGTGREN